MNSSELHRLLQLHGLLLCSLILSSIHHTPVAGADGNDGEVSVEAEADDAGPIDGVKLFFPSHEWQTIHPDETVFAGLHYRINMATGLKEAKLMENDDGSQYYKLLDRWVREKEAGSTANGGFKVTKQIKMPRKPVIEKNSINKAADESGYEGHGLAVVPNEEVQDHSVRKNHNQHSRSVVESAHSPRHQQQQHVQPQLEAHQRRKGHSHDDTLRYQDTYSQQQNAPMNHHHDRSFFEDLKNIDDSHQYINEDDFESYMGNKDGIKGEKTPFTQSEEESSSSPTLKKENASIYNSVPTSESEDFAAGSSTSDTKAKFRSYEELKNDLAELELLIDDEQNVVRNLVQKHQRLSSSDQLISNLEDLEFLLHNIDNAQVFLDAGGLRSVVLRSLSDTAPTIRWLACRLVTACVQNNPSAQIAAYEAGLIDRLVVIMRNEEEKQVAESALSALSTVVRHFPLGQTALLERAGPLFHDVLRKSLYTPGMALQRKTILLLADLLLERLAQDSVDLLLEPQQQQQQRNEQLAAVNLEATLMAWDWCHYLTRNLHQLEDEYNNVQQRQDQPEQQDHDLTQDLETSIDAIMYGMSASADLCPLELRSCWSVMQRLHARFRSLAAAQSDYDLAVFYLQKANDVHDLGAELRLATLSVSGRHDAGKEEL